MEKIVIDDAALNRIKEDARRLFVNSTKEFDLHRILFIALHRYLENQGVSPNFEVKE